MACCARTCIILLQLNDIYKLVALSTQRPNYAYVYYYQPLDRHIPSPLFLEGEFSLHTQS